MQQSERIEAMASVGVMLAVSIAIAVLTYWSGEISDRWSSAPPVPVEGRGAETVQPMLRTDGDDARVPPVPVATVASSRAP